MAVRPSLEELLGSVPPEKLDQPCEDGDLAVLSLSITDWQFTASFLGLTEAEEQAIKQNNTTIERKRLAVLRKWKEKCGKKSTYRKLAKVLYKAGQTGIVTKLGELLQTDDSSDDSDSVPGSVSDDVPSLDDSIVMKYASYLRERYQTRIPSFLSVGWPPAPTLKVFRLAMIRLKGIQRGPIDEKMARLTLHGNVDDIMKMKTEVKLEELCKAVDVKRKIILIEGAPGAGKSTLAWHICQKWESGELFQEFEIVVFVQLRDPAVHAAKSLADLLPARSNALSREVLSKIEVRRGRGLLFVIDSWDEFPPRLRGSEFFRQLICAPQELDMTYSTLIITSRPIASGELHRYVTLRVEIIGFIPCEVKQYFIEALEGDSEAVERLQEHLKERPVIEASCYLPLNAAIIAHIFLSLNQSLPTTLHGVFMSLVICCIIRHIRKQFGEQVGEEIQQKLPESPELDDMLQELPQDIQRHFGNICTMAYHGVVDNKATFSAADLKKFKVPSDLNTLSLIQGVESFTSFKRSVSYSFLHLTMQELLAAFHISKLPADEQVRIFKQLFGQSRFTAVFQFYAAFTRLQNPGIRDVVADIVQEGVKHLQKGMQRIHGVIQFPRGSQQSPEERVHQLFSLFHCLYEAQDLSLCEFVGAKLNGELDFSTYSLQMSPLDYLSLGYFLSSLRLTTMIDSLKIKFSSSFFSDPMFCFLIKGLTAKSERVEEFITTDRGVNACKIEIVITNAVSDEEMQSLSELLCSFSIVKELTLQNCGSVFSEKGGFCIAKGLRNSIGLERLSLINCRFTTKGVGYLAEALIVLLNHHLISLDMRGTPFGNSGVDQICKTLEVNRTLKELNLDFCSVSGEGAIALATVLRVNTSIEILTLSENNLMNGIIDIGRALRCNHSLRELDISYCAITDQALEEFKSIARNSSLKLNLEGNFTDII